MAVMEAPSSLDTDLRILMMSRNVRKNHPDP